MIYLGLYIALVFLTGIFIRYLGFLAAAPEFFLLFLVAVSFIRGPRFGIVFGFFSGLFMDFTSIFLVGSQSFIFATIGYICGLLSKRIYVHQFYNQSIIIFLITFVRFGLNYLLAEIFGVKYSPALSWMILTLVYNVLVFPVVSEISGRLFVRRVAGH